MNEIPPVDGAQVNPPGTHPELAAPRAAYIHVPFCRHRCGYCNFTLIAGRDDLMQRFHQALSLELASLQHPREVDTLFLGGGTPTHLPPSQLAELLSLVKHWFPLAAGYEFSIEANPLDLTPERCAVLADAGISRISLGVQSFDTSKLSALERDHRAADIEVAVARAKQVATSVSIDLIFGTRAKLWPVGSPTFAARSPSMLPTSQPTASPLNAAPSSGIVSSVASWLRFQKGSKRPCMKRRSSS